MHDLSKCEKKRIILWFINKQDLTEVYFQSECVVMGTE